MGGDADHGLWGQVLAFEGRHRDRATAVIAERIEYLRRVREMAKSDFLSGVADCLTQSFAIKWARSARCRGPADLGTTIVPELRRGA